MSAIKWCELFFGLLTINLIISCNQGLNNGERNIVQFKNVTDSANAITRPVQWDHSAVAGDVNGGRLC